MNIFSSMDAAIILYIYMWLVTAVCLYILTLLSYDRVLEKSWSPIYKISYDLS